MLATHEVREMQIQALPAAIKRRSEQLEMPVLYREALAALERCTTMDEGKYYADKADALAAWAKIYGSDEDARAAARLKLKAYSRMGKLAEELRPIKSNGYRLGLEPGPTTLLMEHGLSKHHAAYARRLSKLENGDREKFAKVIEAAKSPSGAVLQVGVTGSTERWGKYRQAMMSFRGYCRNNDASLAKSFSRDEAIKAKEMVVEVWEWLDAFEQALPK